MRFSSLHLALKSDINSAYLIVLCCIASSAQFTTGYELGKDNSVFYSYSTLFTAIFIAMLLLGMTLGSLSVKFLSLHFGRRPLLILSALMSIVGTALVRPIQNIINAVPSTFIARFIDGLACGIGSTVAPIYSKAYSVKEITPSEVSGKYGGLNQVFLTAGICVSVSLKFLKFADLGGLLWWQLGYMVLIVINLVRIALLYYVLPDSPHWYFEKGKKELAKNVIRRIIDNPAAVVDKKIEIKEEVRVDPDSHQGILISISKLYPVIAGAVETCGFYFSLTYSINLNVSDSEETVIAFAFALLLSTFVLNCLVIVFSERDS